MIDYVLDTHACLFALSGSRKLGRSAAKALTAVEEGRARAAIPAAVAAEIVLLRELGRTEIGLPELQLAIDEAPGLGFLPLDFAQLDQFVVLGGIRDAFDRLIVSAARAVGARLISRDASLSELGVVRTVWD